MRSIELTEEEIELIEESLAELPASDLLTGVKLKLIGAAIPADEPHEAADERGSEG